MSSQKATLRQLFKDVIQWVKPRLVPAIVWSLMLPFVVLSRVFLGLPLWLFFFCRASVRKLISQRAGKKVGNLD